MQEKKEMGQDILCIKECCQTMKLFYHGLTFPTCGTFSSHQHFEWQDKRLSWFICFVKKCTSHYPDILCVSRAYVYLSRLGFVCA